MSAPQAFLLATRHGGLALGRNDLGIIAPGGQADIVVFDGNSPGMLGWSDPVAAVILHANVGDIEHVMVGGKFQKRNRTLTALDYPDVQKRFLASAERLQGVWAGMPLPPQEPGTTFMSGFMLGEALQVDALRGAGTGY